MTKEICGKKTWKNTLCQNGPGCTDNHPPQNARNTEKVGAVRADVDAMLSAENAAAGPEDLIEVPWDTTSRIERPLADPNNHYMVMTPDDTLWRSVDEQGSRTWKVYVAPFDTVESAFMDTWGDDEDSMWVEGADHGLKFLAAGGWLNEEAKQLEGLSNDDMDFSDVPVTQSKPRSDEPTKFETLEEIMEMDPNGHPERPTEEDYEQFEGWVVDTYGQKALDDYRSFGDSEDALYDPGAEDNIPSAAFHAENAAVTSNSDRERWAADPDQFIRNLDGKEYDGSGGPVASLCAGLTRAYGASDDTDPTYHGWSAGAGKAMNALAEQGYTSNRFSPFDSGARPANSPDTSPWCITPDDVLWTSNGEKWSVYAEETVDADRILGGSQR